MILDRSHSEGDATGGAPQLGGGHAYPALGYQQQTWRHWGEDVEEDAIFAVYLKKVRYHRPAKTVTTDTEDDISHLEWETVKVRLIKAGTLQKLVECLASESGELESTYVNVFLATYRAFSSCQEVLGLMLDRYVNLQSSSSSLPSSVISQHLKTYRQTLAVWLDGYPEDFYQPPEHPMLVRLLSFLREHCRDASLESRVRTLMDRSPAAPDEENSFVTGSGTGSDSDSGLGLPRCVSPLPSSLLFSSRYASIMEIATETVAEQITRMDAECFRRLQPHQCLGALWSRKAAQPESCATVRACVDQFNAVSFHVLSTLLTDPDMKSSQRAKMIVKWVEIAQVLRLVKNFSSLKAIISGLQSTPIYRLRKLWLSVPRDKVELFDELSRMVSEENNQSVPRELLIKEGTAKTAQVVSDRDRQLPRAMLKQGSRETIGSIQYGTIPYLGTFLTDLNMIDTAHPNVANGGLINFDKRRKEFEVIAQIKLLQGSASAYAIPPDERFNRWFDSVPSLDDKAAFELSCLIEPQIPPSTPTSAGSGNHIHHNHRASGTPTGKMNSGPRMVFHQKTDSLTSFSSEASSNQGTMDITDSLSSTGNPDPYCFDRKMSTSSSCSSIPSLEVSPSPQAASPLAQEVASNSSSLNSSHTSTPTPSRNKTSTSSTGSQQSPYRTPEYYIIRVSIEDVSNEIQGVNLYKSIMLSNNERTPSVIRNAMLKHGIEGKADEYTLAQILPHGEMVFPSTGNVYYAINTSYDLNFILRRKRPGEEVQKTGIRIRDSPKGGPGSQTKKRLLALMT